MPSTLIVENGSGVTGANAYLAAGDMVAYFALVGVDISAWSTARQEQRIVLATRYMGAQYRTRWQGRRINYQQSLDWPRYDVLLSLGEDVDLWFPGYGPGYATADSTVPQNIVPAEVKAACCELAYRADLNFAKSGPSALMPDIAARETQITNKTVGPVSISYAPGGVPVTVYNYVNALLRPYLRAGDNQMRLIRG